MPNNAKTRLNVPWGVEVHFDSLEVMVATTEEDADAAAAVTVPLPPPRGMDSRRWRRVDVVVTTP